MLQILRETTEWSTDKPVRNHTYLIDQSNRLIAYAKFGTDEVVVSKSQIKLDKRYRTFVRDDHPALVAITKKQKQDPNTRVFKVNSNTKDYIVSIRGSNYSCTCTGYSFRGKCKHITAVAEMIQSAESA